MIIQKWVDMGLINGDHLLSKGPRPPANHLSPIVTRSEHMRGRYCYLIRASGSKQAGDLGGLIRIL